LALLNISASPPTKPSEDFNKDDVLWAVHMLETDRAHGGRAHGGYDLDKSYSQPLSYPSPAAIPQGPKGRSAADHQTMCVAAVAEVMIEAINRYAAEHPEAALFVNGRPNPNSPYNMLPAAGWRRSDVKSIRPFIFVQGSEQNILGRGLYETPRGKTKKGNIVIAYARGTGQALATFEIREELPFSALKPGDFVNFNRDSPGTDGKRHYSGHAVVFLNFIDKDNHYTEVYSADVIGFEYFSAQGMATKDHPAPPDAGFARRDAYFGAYNGPTVSHSRDRYLVRPKDDHSTAATSLLQLSGGRMWSPSRWNVSKGLAAIERLVRVNTPLGLGKRRGGEINLRLRSQNTQPAVDFTEPDDE